MRSPFTKTLHLIEFTPDQPPAQTGSVAQFKQSSSPSLNKYSTGGGEQETKAVA